MSASTARLLKLGLHNTASQLIEGRLSSQKRRLELTSAGRKLLTELQWTPQGLLQPKALVPEMREAHTHRAHLRQYASGTSRRQKTGQSP